MGMTIVALLIALCALLAVGLAIWGIVVYSARRSRGEDDETAPADPGVEPSAAGGPGPIVRQ